MNTDRFEGNLKQIRGKVNEQWGKFTKDSQREFAGMRDQCSGKSQEQYGITKEKAARQLKDFMRRNSNWHDWNK
jgi:uncharacterized protein YjbJ (UPF0337 family)